VSHQRDNLLIAMKVALVLLAGLGGIYWWNQRPATPRRTRPPAFTVAPPRATPLEPAAGNASAPAVAATPPDAAPEPPVPSAAERVAAAMARSKQAAADAAAAREAELLQPSAMPLEDLIARAMPGVVMVQSDKTRGSGFFVRPDLVVTNGHVTAGAISVSVTSQAGVRMAGRVAQVSDAYDLALIQVEPPGPADAPLRLGASATLRLGQGIVALGFAQSLAQSSVTRGVITGLRLMGQREMIQTDASPNHGDSGGPVIDRVGDVIGVTTLRFDNGSGGLAIPIDDVKPFIARIPGTAR
jgi:S1-C subfamily serine protease